jgi:hypothetical protein
MENHEERLIRIESGNSKTHDLLGELVQAISGLTTAFKYSVEKGLGGKERIQSTSWQVIAACGGIIFGVMAPMYFAINDINETNQIISQQIRLDNDREAMDKGEFAKLLTHSEYDRDRLDRLESVVFNIPKEIK